MQKAADEKYIVETLERIKRDDDANPESIIEEEFGDLNNVEEMWDDRRDGKPRSHWSNGWLLDMKNFPNKMLPGLTPDDAANALQLPMDNKQLHKVFEVFANYHTAHKDDDPAYTRIDLSDIPVEYADKLKHLLNPPACSACRFYTKMRGTHYCGMKVCYKRKTSAWHREMIRAASKNLGIPVYEETDGPYLVLESYEAGHKALFEKRHKDLRLIAKELITARGYFSQYSFKGVEDSVFMAVAIGETATRLAKSKRGGKGTAIDRTAQRRAKLFDDKRMDLIWEFTSSAKALFEKVPGEFISQLNGWKYLGVDFRPPAGSEPDKNATDEEQDDYSRRLLTWRLLDLEEHESLADTADALGALAREWGLKAPATLKKRATQMDAEIEAAFPQKQTPKKGKKS